MILVYKNTGPIHSWFLQNDLDCYGKRGRSHQERFQLVLTLKTRFAQSVTSFLIFARIVYILSNIGAFKLYT